MQWTVRKGMNVRSTSGLSLGTIAAAGANTFMVQKGMFFPRDHELKLENITDIRGNDVIYMLDEETRAQGAVAFTAGAWQTTELAEGKELRVPLMEEEVYVQKKAVDAGAVRIHKAVITEEKQITVPIRHEEIYVERVPADRSATSAHAFVEERYSIPLHEEEFEVSKRPVVKEEVRVSRKMLEEQRAASATLRHEEIELEDTSRRPNRLHAQGLHFKRS